MKTVKIILVLFFSLHFCNSFSQYYYYNDRYYDTRILFELGVGAGAMNCITDIGGANSDYPNYLNEIRKKNNRFCSSIYAAINYQDLAAVKLEGTLGEVMSDDSSIAGKSNNL